MSRESRRDLLIDKVRHGEASRSEQAKFDRLMANDPHFRQHVKEIEASVGEIPHLSFAEVAPNQERVESIGRIVRIGIQQKRMEYWSPILVGAITAAVGFFALLQVLAYQPDSQPVNLGNAKAELTDEANRLPTYSETGR